MADFTHTMRVVATMDDGRTITMSNVFTIADVYYSQNSDGYSDVLAVPQGPPPLAQSDFMICRSPNEYWAARIINGNADQMDVTMSNNQMFILHGPEAFTVSANAADATNTELLDTVEFDSQGVGQHVEFMSLNKAFS